MAGQTSSIGLPPRNGDVSRRLRRDSQAVSFPELTSIDTEYDSSDVELQPNPMSRQFRERESEDEDNSIYPEVRAAVPASDEDVPINTVRAWMLGIISTVVSAGFTQLFGLHDPPLAMSPYVLILAAFPIGSFLARYTPRWEWTLLGRRLESNPGPFSTKEHTIIAIMAIGSAGFNHGALATYVWTAMETNLGFDNLSLGFKLLFFLTTQSLGFGLAGIFQKLIVDPPYCMWPAILPMPALIHSLHRTPPTRMGKRPQHTGSPGTAIKHVARHNAFTSWTISPLRFFWVAFGAISVWHLVPGFFFTSITYFSWVTWIRPNDVLVNQLFGARSGMDLLPLALSWSQVTAYQSPPQATSIRTVSNVLGGAVLFLWIIGPALHFSNVWYGHYLPFSSSSIFDNTGKVYDTSRVVNSPATGDHSFNSTAYFEYSPVYLSTTSAISYGLGFGAVSSVIVHAALNFRDEIWDGLWATFTRNEVPSARHDIHGRLMRKYPRIPLWWYLIALAVAVGLSIFFVEYYQTGVSWWGVLLSVSINLILFAPIAILDATCNQNLSTDAVSSLLGGYLWPSNMVASVVFRCLSFNAIGSGLYLARNRKLGHYMKVPPRVVFCAQSLGIIINWLVQTGVNVLAFACPLSATYESSMVFWGLISPQRLFSRGATYAPMLWFFPIGAALPLLFYGASRVRIPTSAASKSTSQIFEPTKPPLRRLRFVNIPLILSSIGNVPPATASNYMTWGIIGIFFQWFLRKRHFAWWHRYNFLLAAALEGGLALSSLFIFLAFSYPGVVLTWWGNTVESTTADYAGTPLAKVSAGQIFGPSAWS
ncbi:small oligopeptide transporter [Grosmannia clavigera kw1407]|uniref:Small oligopeptide transporter n=1 Tax=Grosmannia clavigera (strain kw1407 / UAMH 11150) TaxID=655863 RepID=F0XF52_GROCL|nr:small oligopeptide transporter [Grosmannia clavigera kw1407]EFX03915.1 small oligopeptide transporter [Grosmannia clavigera kw1407]